MYVSILTCICPFIYPLNVILIHVSIIKLSVHLVNRRMDEWVNVDRIALAEGAIEDTPKEDSLLDSLNGRERTVTRNIKRRHDEINHVQKVCEMDRWMA